MECPNVGWKHIMARASYPIVVRCDAPEMNDPTAMWNRLVSRALILMSQRDRHSEGIGAVTYRAVICNPS